MPPIKRHHLLSLGALATFEVAARHLSFTRAARELNVTQGAVSQQIRLLERALDVALFVRRHNALDLTHEGSELFHAVTAGLDTISEAVSVMTDVDDPRAVTVSGTDAMASFWLQPLIDSFRARHPEIGFTALASDADDTLRNHADVDLAILCGNERCEIGEELYFLFPEVAQPVCTPEFRRRHGPSLDLARLNEVNLLHLHDRHWSADAIGWQSMGWPEWFRARGGEWAKALSSFSTNKVSLLMAAALAGQRVMLGWYHMVEAPIRDGWLVHAHPVSITAGRGDFLNVKKKALTRPSVASLAGSILDFMIVRSSGRLAVHGAGMNEAGWFPKEAGQLAPPRDLREWGGRFHLKIKSVHMGRMG